MSTNSAPLKTGSIVRIWHGTRGHDYVVACVNRSAKKLGLIKNNCINNDGDIHASTVEVHKWIDFHNIAGRKIVPKVNRVIGTRALSKSHLVRFLRETCDEPVIALTPEYGVYPTVDAGQDNRAATQY